MLPSIDDAYGGPPRTVASLLALSDALDMPVRVIAGATRPGDVAGQVAARADLDVFSPGLLLGRVYGSLRMLRAIWTAVGAADVVLAHSLFTLPVVFSGLACRLRGTPWILAPHSCLDPYDLRKHYRLKRALAPLWRVLLRGADVWCLTDVEARHLVTFGSHPRRHVVPPPVDLVNPMPVEAAVALLAASDLDLRTTVDAGGCVVSFVGRFDPKKGIPRLIDCFDRVAGPDDVLVLAGAGEASYDSVVHAGVARAKRREQVRLPGWLSDEQRTALWSLPGFFALPSDNENFAVAVAEAMAAGVPVVTTDRVGLADLVRLSGAGLVTAADAPEFAAAMTVYLDDAPRRRRDGEHGRAAVQGSLSVAATLDGFRRMIATAMAA